MIKPHHAVHVAGVVLTSAALVAWSVTGREGFTRWPDEKLAGADAAPSEDESALLAEAGFNEPGKPATAPDIQSRFALGLAPSGGDPKHLLSVATAVAAAVIASGATLAWRARRRRQEHGSNERQSQGHSR